MSLDLQQVVAVADACGFDSRASATETRVRLSNEVQLIFRNLADGESVMGFEGTTWHAHPPFIFVTDDGGVRSYSEVELVEGLADGNLLVVEMWEQGVLADRWLEHRETKMNLSYHQSGEELRVRGIEALGG